jgi:hypothetical protein
MSNRPPAAKFSIPLEVDFWPREVSVSGCVWNLRFSTSQITIEKNTKNCHKREKDTISHRSPIDDESHIPEHQEHHLMIPPARITFLAALKNARARFRPPGQMVRFSQTPSRPLDLKLSELQRLNHGLLRFLFATRGAELADVPKY